MTVTKADLEALRAAPPRLNAEMHYTMGGYTETLVHSSIYAEWTSKLTRGDRTLQHAHMQLKRDMALARHKGQARVQFSFANTVRLTMTVTKADLEALRAAPLRLNTETHYTIGVGGYTETQLHTSSYAQSTGELKHGDKKLQHAHMQVRRSMSLTRHEGQANVQFNVANTVKP